MYSVSSVRQTTKVALQPFLESSRICACTVERFKRYLETDLLPHLNGNSVLAMDNMKSHHAKAVKELLDSSGVRYIYLPPYSPDLNPIEKLWSKIKALLRKFKARNHHPAPTARLHSAKRRAAFCWVSVKQFSKNDTATACQDWLRSTRLGRGSIKSHVRTVKVLGMGLFAFQERIHLWKGVTH